MSDWKNVQYKNGKMRTSEGGGGGGSSTFAGLDDVSFSNLQNGQIPKYNSTTQKWENANESGGGGTVTDVQVDGTSVVNQQGVAEITMPTPPSVPDELSDLSDVQFSNLTDHQPLRYNATSQKWENGADSYPPLIYSDEEREVGVWRDGKPLYQRTIPCNLSVVPNWAVLDDSVSYESLANLIVESSDGEMIFFNSFSSLPRFRIDAFSQNDHKLYYYIETAGNYLITIQYTKSTDTAGSGTWTTQGGYAHHYSTSEKVIGTWIDGKPLYERVFEQTILNLTANTWSATTIAQGSMKCPVNIEIVITSSSTNSVHKGISGAFIDGYLKINSFRNLGLDTGYTAWVVLQYTKTTD